MCPLGRLVDPRGGGSGASEKRGVRRAKGGARSARREARRARCEARSARSGEQLSQTRTPTQTPTPSQSQSPCAPRCALLTSRFALSAFALLASPFSRRASRLALLTSRSGPSHSWVICTPRTLESPLRFARFADSAVVLRRVKAEPLLRSGAARSPAAPARSLDTSSARRLAAGAFARLGAGTNQENDDASYLLDDDRHAANASAGADRHREARRGPRKTASTRFGKRRAQSRRRGSGSAGGTRTARYRTTLGSARETGACLDVAEALGYCGQVDVALRGKIAVVVSGLLRLTT
jgi:hypothetical protein